MFICFYELETRIRRGDLRKGVRKGVAHEIHFKKSTLNSCP